MRRSTRQLSAVSPLTTIFVADTSGKNQKSFLAEVFPVIALMVGVPLIVWYADKAQKRGFRQGAA